MSAFPKVPCPCCGDLKPKSYPLGGREGFCLACTRSVIRVRMASRALKLIKAIAQDKSLKQIASEWRISVKTLEHHWDWARALLGVRTYVSAALYAVKLGVIKL